MVLVLSACGQPQAMGQPNSLIVVAADSLWAEVEDSTYAVLEPTIFTTREENRFNVTQVDPSAGEFLDLRNIRQLLVFGTADDPRIRQVAAAADRVGTLEVPSVFQASEVWARGQVVTAILLEEGREVETWLGQLPAVLGMVDSDYRAFVRAKMFVTPPDTALATDLAERFGFSLLVPEVYDHVVREGPLETVAILRNDNPDPSQLIRSILVTWRDGVDSLTAETALAWRADVDGIHYNVPQRINAERSTVTGFAHGGAPALEVTGVWEDEEGNYPAAGPFIVWLVRCGDRTFLLDAWLYAPGRDKYEYILQLQEILGSFACAPSTG
jgi:hypothetical protein